jgi:hypothetical protein
VRSARPTSQPGQAHGADAYHGARDVRVTRNAWLLAALALAFYVGYIGWLLWRSLPAP